VIAVGVDPDAADGLSLLSVQECAALLGVSGEAVRRACREGVLTPVYRLGDGPKARYRIPAATLANYLRDAHEARRERR
jgi:excisionase family DNA binding protein